jgi:hypothetical protein
MPGNSFIARCSTGGGTTSPININFNKLSELLQVKVAHLSLHCTTEKFNLRNSSWPDSTYSFFVAHCNFGFIGYKLRGRGHYSLKQDKGM